MTHKSFGLGLETMLGVMEESTALAQAHWGSALSPITNLKTLYLGKRGVLFQSVVVANRENNQKSIFGILGWPENSKKKIWRQVQILRGRWIDPFCFYQQVNAR